MRKAISMNSTVKDVIVEMSEGNPGAINVLMNVLQSDPDGFMRILDLDDMNIRGSQIWLGYKDVSGGDLEKFLKSVKNRSRDLVDGINERQGRSGGNEVAVISGASFKR